MLTMAHIQYIKHLRDREDRSIAEIARLTNVDRRIAKKYADREDCIMREYIFHTNHQSPKKMLDCKP